MLDEVPNMSYGFVLTAFKQHCYVSVTFIFIQGATIFLSSTVREDKVNAL